MYFPYLRGRQFELIALRELVDNNLIGDKIIPIIEPVKLSSTLTSTLSTFIKNNKQVAIIMNPKIGNFYKELSNKGKGSCSEIFSQQVIEDSIIKSYIINENIEKELTTKINHNKLLIINKEKDDLNYFLNIFKNSQPMYTIIPENRSFKRILHKSKVLLEDKFNKTDRNSDYLYNEDEFFSDDHLYFSEENYNGFSDYSIVGEGYKESGFAPLAVAIHIVYFDDNKELRIKHFVSDSNIDINNPAGKFSEALKKLICWIENYSTNPNFVDSYALNQFKKLYDSSKYPGLGTVKKLCIMHHIELINYYLERI